MRTYINDFKDSPIYAGGIIASIWILAIVSFSVAMLGQVTSGIAGALANAAAKIANKGESVAIVRASGHDVAMFAVGIVLSSDSSKNESSEMTVAPATDQVDEGDVGNSVSDHTAEVEKVPASTNVQADDQSKVGDDSEEHH